MRTLNFNENPTEILTLDELKLSVDEVSTTGKPFNGITHYQLFDSLGDIATKHNVKIEFNNLYATDSKNKINPGVSIFPHLEEVHGKNALQAALLRRIVGSITFPEYADGDSNSGVAINFHQKGIEMCYGMNVRVCSNLNIYGDTFIMSYGQNGMPIKQMLEVYENWIHKLPEFRQKDLMFESQMRDTFLPIGDTYKTLIGKLAVMAVNSAYVDSKVDAPLNIGQVSKFTKSFINQYGLEPDQPMNVWELFNMATNILKPGQMNSEELLRQSYATGKFFVDEYLESEITY